MDYDSVRAQAKEFLNIYNPTGLVPFPFEETVRRLENVEIIYLSKLNDNISGAIFFQDGAFTIAINANKPKNRQNFTIAHELGHYYLHSEWLKKHPADGFIDYSSTLDGTNALLRPDALPTSAEAIIREKEANNFAAEILMPADKVKTFWSLTHDIIECADAFQVSKSAMAIRLERLGLV